MEPFGFFDLLKTLAPKAEEKPSVEAENPTENNAPPPTAQAETFSPPSNACVDFLSRHDQRAKRTKR